MTTPMAMWEASLRRRPSALPLPVLEALSQHGTEVVMMGQVAGGACWHAMPGGERGTLVLAAERENDAMKAIVQDRYGSADVLELREVQDPDAPAPAIAEWRAPRTLTLSAPDSAISSAPAITEG